MAAAAPARDLDVVVYGASGFTGQRVLQTLLELAPPTLRIGAAGRDEAKLRVAVDRAQAAAASSSSTRPPVAIIVAPTSDPQSLARMAARTRLVLACAGPFRLCGRPVADACVMSSADYLDVSGEPAYIEQLELDLSSAAERAGVFLASAAAFDSIPSDLGCLFVQRAFVPPAVPSSVEAVIRVVPGSAGYRINAATYDSAVLGVAAADDLRALRKRAARARAERENSAPPPPKPVGPRPPPHAAGPTFDKSLDVYTLPFPGADASVVRRTQAELACRAAAGDASAEPPVYFGVRFSVGSSPINVAKAVACGGAFMALARGVLGEWGRRLLMSKPSIFSAGLVSRGQGPTEEQMAQVQTHLDFVGRGYASREEAAAGGAPTLISRARVSLGDLGYQGTSKIFVTAALTLLEERQALERATGKKGGVFTAGGLFRLSTLVERLQREGGVKFELLSPPAPVAVVGAAESDAAAAAV